MSEYRYKFSVVIPVYKVEKYLEETVESVVNQDIGFEENIQIILVNDGTPDDSEKICLAYRDRFPNNVIYVKKENGGVSSARNKGIEYVEGKYVNFLDSDDKWALDAFSKAYEFFERRYDKIDLVACPQKFFEASDEYHPLKYKFEEGDRVVDILDKYDNIQLHITASFLKFDAVKDLRFDERLKYAEDSKYVTEVILQKLSYGLLASTTHYYRKRKDDSSAVQGKTRDMAWYFDTPKYNYEELFQKSREQFGFVLPYLQYVFMYDMQFRVREKNADFLSEEKMKEYHSILRELLQDVEDYIICEPGKMFLEHKLAVFSLKYGKDIKEDVVYRGGIIYFHNIRIYAFNSTSLFKVLKIEDYGDCVQVRGEVWCPFTSRLSFTMVDRDKKEFPVTLTQEDYKHAICFNKTVMDPYVFDLKLPKTEKSYRINCLFDGKYPQNIHIAYGDGVKNGKRYVEAKISSLSEEVDPDSDLTILDKDISARKHIQNLLKKYGPEYERKLKYKSGNLLFHNMSVINLKAKGNLLLEEINIMDNTLVIEGRMTTPLHSDKLEYFVMDGEGEKYEVIPEGERDEFVIHIPLSKKVKSIRFMYMYLGIYTGRIALLYEDKLRIVDSKAGSQLVKKGWRMVSEKNILKAYPLSKKEVLKWRLHLK